MSVILTMHETTSARDYRMYRADRSCDRGGAERTTRRIPCDKFNNEERDHYWCLWWNRRIDRKTFGKRRVFGGGELSRKIRFGVVFSGGWQRSFWAVRAA